MTPYTVGFDTEFFDTNEPKMCVVCSVLDTPEDVKKTWLLGEEKEEHTLLTHLDHINKTDGVLLAYAASAEARSLLSINIDPAKYRWVDLYVEFTMLCNSNNKYKYGKYLDSGGIVKYSKPPPRDMSEEDKAEAKSHGEDYTETPKNLASALFKMLGIIIDTEEKIEMRDLILSKDRDEIENRSDEILEYCLSDTKYLRKLDAAITQAFWEEGLQDFRKDQLERGQYSIATAKCEHLGIPLDVDLLKRIVSKTPEILESYKPNIQKHFPFFSDAVKREPFIVKSGPNKGKTKKFKDIEAKQNMGEYQKFIKGLNIENFPKTSAGKFSMTHDTLIEYRDHHPAIREMVLFSEIKKNLKWFDKKNGKGFHDRIGSDNRVRPYYGIFGTQTGRNAPRASTFPMAMSSWLRALIKPPKGKFIIGEDFSQQEVYIAASLSEDEALLQAYKSGDVYLEFAKQSSMVPQDATKSSHKRERNLCKATVLGLQFGMGAAKLKLRLSKDSGSEVSDEETKTLINAHKATYWKYWEWVSRLTDRYKSGEPLITKLGWVLFQDNPVITSVRNWPIQAHGADILRLSIVRAMKSGLNVLFGMHDAIYIETSTPLDDYKKLKLIMLEATKEVLQQTADNCFMRIDIKIVGNSKPWVDEKGKKDWDLLCPILYEHNLNKE